MRGHESSEPRQQRLEARASVEVEKLDLHLSMVAGQSASLHEDNTVSRSPELESIAARLAGTFPASDDAPLGAALLRALVSGEAVTGERLAHAVGRPPVDVEAVLSRWPNVKRNEHGEVVAFGGLSLDPTIHRIEVDGRDLFTWCAWDTLFLPALLDRGATVDSVCPVSGTAVRLRVEPDRVDFADPANLMVSFPALDATFVEDITGSFCCHVYFLAGECAVAGWIASTPGGFVLSLDDAFELGLMATSHLRPA